MSAPELHDEEDEMIDDEESAMQLDPAVLKKKIAALQAKLDELADEEAGGLVTARIPYDATGDIVRINGKKYIGEVTVSPSTLQQIRSMLSAKLEIERERLMRRGNKVGTADLERADTATKIIKRHEGSRIL